MSSLLKKLWPLTSVIFFQNWIAVVQLNHNSCLNVRAVYKYVSPILPRDWKVAYPIVKFFTYCSYINIHICEYHLYDGISRSYKYVDSIGNEASHCSNKVFLYYLVHINTSYTLIYIYTAFSPHLNMLNDHYINSNICTYVN